MDVMEHAIAPTMAQVRRRADGIKAAAAQHGIERVRVVGSVSRGVARPDSDVDLLVSAGVSLTGARYFAALDRFREACEGILRRPVDVIDEATVTSPAARARLDADSSLL